MLDNRFKTQSTTRQGDSYVRFVYFMFLCNEFLQKKKKKLIFSTMHKCNTILQCNTWLQ